ncbi:hypothetical protein [Prosthecobacter sp.]|jgi:hypothetical protein|uniref:hypothetical protein n=1 Tax=Prosthecobacter sp. TaxID=1965333 RepID=UPI0037835E44
MTATLPAPVAELKGRIDELSVEDRLLLEEVLRVESEDGKWAGLPWPWEMLDKRKAALNAGESAALPLDEVADRLRARRSARS